MLALGGVLVGALLTYGVASIIPTNVPFMLDGLSVISYSALLVGVALAGTLLSLYRIAKIEALLAIGRVD